MALSDETLQEIVSNMTPEDRQLLYKQLGIQIEKDKEDIKAGRIPQSPTNKPRPIPNNNDGKIYCCVYCGSASIKRHGETSAGNQRYYCKDCEKSFTENHGSALRYTHIDKDTWLVILRGFVNHLSIVYQRLPKTLICQKVQSGYVVRKYVMQLRKCMVTVICLMV